LRNVITAGIAGRLGETAQVPIGGDLSADLVIVEQDPAQRVEARVFALRAEFARVVGEVCEDGSGLAELLCSINQDRRFAHFVDGGAKLGRALVGLAEEIHKHRLPVGANEIEHQRDAIGIAGLGKAMQLILSHERLRPWDLSRQRHRCAVRLMALETAGGKRQLRKRLAFVVAHDQRATLIGPLAAGVEIAGAAAFGRDRALAGARGIAEIHDARAA